MASSNPYIGPRSFQLNETIYGRDRELRQLTDRLIAERIVLLHAPSGAGKTSLIQAGLIPRLQEEGFFVYPVIRVNLEQPPEEARGGDSSLDLRPANRYILSTLLSLEERYPVKQRMKASRLARMSVQNYLAFRSIEEQRDGPELLVFDQFEEALTIDPVDREAKRNFFSHLGMLLKNRNRWALFSMRSDYVGALEPYVRSVPTYFANTFHLDLLGVKAALEAIQKPAQKNGVNFNETTAKKLVDDLRRVQIQLLDGSVEAQLGLYIEPVQLQVVCYRIWEGKTDEDRVIDEADLANVGDVNNSLAEYYASSLAQVAETTGNSERSLREWFARKLITPEGIRSQARLGAETCEGLPVEAVYQLEDTHLIRRDRRAGQTWLELAHDRLIGPVQSDNAQWFDANLSLFQRQAVLWAGQGFSDGLLLRGKEFEAAQVEARTLTLTPDEKAFLEACQHLYQHEMRDKRQRQFILTGLIFSLVFLALAVMGFFTADAQRRDADLQRQKAQAAAVAAQNAQAAAVTAQAGVQAASTQAIAQQATSQASLIQQATAEAGRFVAMAEQATAIAAAATAQFDAGEQTKLAQANSLVSRSILMRQREPRLSALLALEAFHLADIPATRIQLLSYLRHLALPGIFNPAATTTYLEFSLDQSYLIHSSYTSYSRYDPNSNLGGVIKARDLKTGRQLGESFGLAGLLDAVAFSPDGTVIASASCIPSEANGRNCEVETLTLWDAKTRAAVKTMTLAEDFRYQSGHVLLAFSPDGNLLASAVNGTTIFLWDLETCIKLTPLACVATSLPQTGQPVRMAFLPDQKTLVLLQERQILFLDTSYGQVTKKLAIDSADRFTSLAISRDGQTVAAGTNQGNIYLWEWELSRQVGLPLNYIGKSEVLSLAFNPDGRLLAAGHTDSALVLWEVSAHEKLFPVIYRHQGPVFSVAFSGDGKKLASSGNSILLSDTDPASWVAQVCVIAGRNFTQAEWTQYFPDQPYQTTCSLPSVGQ